MASIPVQKTPLIAHSPPSCKRILGTPRLFPDRPSCLRPAYPLMGFTLQYYDGGSKCDKYLPQGGRITNFSAGEPFFIMSDYSY